MSIWYANYSSRLDKRSQCHTSSLKFWWTTIAIKVKMIKVAYRIAHCVCYKWCANEPCMCALDALITNIIFLLEYSSVYSQSWIQRVFYNGCSRELEKFVRINGVSRVHTYLIMNWVNGMRIWRAVRGEGSELGSSSRARGTPLAQGEGSELGIGPDPKAPPTPAGV